ncbi:TonB-dependent receptor [Pelobium sp.]|nr:TonB-dependent receptor [Pelobium sp.]MDA9555192.1 TonB-dependent receptor [Pelobium sp.]
MRFFNSFILIFTIVSSAFSQTVDSLKTLPEVTVKAYLSEQKLISLPSSASVINQLQIQKSGINSILPVLNTISGVKMEERSPGSYRIAIRGSLLRSPFGVRNIKFYYDDFPLTDAGGNTYINLIDQSAIKNIEVLKGPDGSLFGANSGGVILLNTQAKADENSVNLTSGSYGFFRQAISINQNRKNIDFNFNQAIQRSDGYRENSQLKRYFFQTQEKWRYNKKGSLKFSGFYSNLGYETPGGLNLTQYTNNPQSARPRVGNTPGAIEQKAGIYNKTVFAGLNHQIQFSKSWKHVISLSDIYTDFKNPFITNYEKRIEQTAALRTYFEYQNRENSNFKYQWNTGWEYALTQSDIRNYGNNQGVATNILAADRIKNQSQFLFTRFALQSGEHLKAELSTSLNLVKYDFKALPESTNSTLGSQNLKGQFMPRLAVSYLITPEIVVRGIISRGFSAPTTAEIRASDQRINQDLKPESGWNHEFGFRARTPSESIFIDISAFYYRLNDAIVRRVNANDQDYYVNAGGTTQKGLELNLSTRLLAQENGFIRKILFNNALTLSDFKFRDYFNGSVNYSGNQLTGIPKLNWMSNVNIDFKQHLNLYIQYQLNGKTTLNDAATAFADSYQLVFLKLNWEKPIGKNLLSLNFGVDNLLNEKYSLGNDLNASVNRYFNAATPRNYFAGIGFKF